MDKFNEAARTAYEQYLLTDESLDDALMKMIPGSKYHDYLKIIDALKKQKGQKGSLPKEILDMIKKFKKKGGPEAKRLDYQSLFIEFDNLVDDKKQQKKLLKKLSGPKYLKLGLRSKRKAPEDNSEEGEKSESDDESRKHTLVYSHEDHYKELLKKIMKESASLSEIHPSLVNRIDYKNLSEKYFEQFMLKYPFIADITHESFIVKVAETLNSLIKKSKGDLVSSVLQRLCGDSSDLYKR